MGEGDYTYHYTVTTGIILQYMGSFSYESHFTVSIMGRVTGEARGCGGGGRGQSHKDSVYKRQLLKRNDSRS